MSLKTKVVKKVVKYALSTKRGKKLLSEAQKLIHKKKSKTIQQLSVKGVHKDVPLRVSSDKQVKTFKQKPKIGEGQEPVTTAGTRYGTGATEHKVYEPGAALARKRWGTTWPHEREGWRAQMDRMYGGVHMSQDPKRIKKSLKLLTKKLKKKKIKKATEGGEVVIHDNVDRSLL